MGRRSIDHGPSLYSHPSLSTWKQEATLRNKLWSRYRLPWFVSVFGFGLVFDHRLRRFCFYHKITNMHAYAYAWAFSNAIIFFSESWSGSVSIKGLGHPMNWAKRLRLIKYCTYFKSQSEDRNLNPTFFSFKRLWLENYRGQESLGETKKDTQK